MILMSSGAITLYVEEMYFLDTCHRPFKKKNELAKTTKSFSLKKWLNHLCD